MGVGLQKAWVLSLVLAMLVFPSGMRAKAKAEGMVARARDTVYRDYRCFYSWESLKKTTLGMGLAGVVANTSMDGEIQGWVQESLRDEDTDELSESVKPFGEGRLPSPSMREQPSLESSPRAISGILSRGSGEEDH